MNFNQMIEFAQMVRYFGLISQTKAARLKHLQNIDYIMNYA